MNFDLSEEQEQFRSSVERFAGDLDARARSALRSRDGGYDPARWRALAGMGLLALAAGEDRGGLGGSPIDLAIIAEALGRTIAPDPWLENGVLAVRLLESAGNTDLLDGVLSGSAMVAVAMAERQARYSLVARQTKAAVRGDGYVITGEKTLVLGAPLAGTFLVTAALDSETAVFVIPADRARMFRHDYRIVDGSVASEIRFNAVEVSGSERLPLDLAALNRAIDDLRLIAAGELLGLAQRLFDDTHAYIRQREQFGVAIGTFQVIQHRMVDCYAMLEQSRSTLYRAALSDRDDVSGWRRATAGAKTFIGECAGHIAREAVQLHGGMGITDELSVGHAFKRVMLLTTLFGDSDATLAEYAEAA